MNKTIQCTFSILLTDRYLTGLVEQTSRDILALLSALTPLGVSHMDGNNLVTTEHIAVEPMAVLYQLQQHGSHIVCQATGTAIQRIQDY